MSSDKCSLAGKCEKLLGGVGEAAPSLEHAGFGVTLIWLGSEVNH